VLCTYRKSWGIIFPAIILTLIFAFINTGIAGEAPKHRFVVLVYDDSGSMSENQSTDWEKANYSLQSLAALLDSNDRLYVVRMSAPGSVQEVRLDPAIRQQSIDQIKTTGSIGPNTPFQTVGTAASFLESAPRNYQRWLVISSDGRFQTGDREVNESEFYSYLDDYINHTGNKDINLVFLAIGSQVPAELKTAWMQAVVKTPMEAADSAEIIARMNEISALITSRDPSHPLDGNLRVKYFNGNGVRLSSPFPLRRLTVLYQGSSDIPLTLRSIRVNNKPSQLQVSGPFLTGTPLGGSEQIAGRFLHIGTSGSEIPEGTYTLVFEQDISKQHKNLKFLPETALDFTCEFYKQENGKTVRVTSANAMADDIVEARVQILSANGKKPLKLAGIANLVEVTANIGSYRGISLQSDIAHNCFTAHGVKLAKGSIDAHFTMTVRGWYQGSKNIHLEVKYLPPRQLGLRITPAAWNCPVDQLQAAAPIMITPLANGRPMTQEEFAEIKNNLKLTAPGVRIQTEPGEQAFKLYIKKSKWGVAFTGTGQFVVKAELQGRVPGERISGDVHLTISDIPWYKKYGPLIAWPLGILLLLVYVYGIITKPRFFSASTHVKHKRETADYDWEFTPERTEGLSSSWARKYLVPFTPETVQIGSIQFIATGRASSIKLSQESLQNLLRDKGTQIRLAGCTIDADEVTHDLIMGLGDELLIRRPGRQEWFSYPNENQKI